MIRNHLVAALHYETANNEPAQSAFLPKVSPNVRNVLLHQIAAEVREDEELFSCLPDFENNENDDDLRVL